MLVQAISTGSIFSAYSVIAAPLKVEFMPSNMVLMLGITVTALGSGLLSPALGVAIDRFSVRKLMLFGSSLVAVGFWLMSVSTSMVQVIAVYAVFMSAGCVLLGPIATSALLARWFTHNRGLAMGIAGSGAAIGGFLMPPLLQGLIDQLAWREALQAFSAITLVISIPLIAWLVVDRPTPPADPRPDIGRTDEGARDLAATKPKLQLSAGAALRDTNFWLIALTLGVLFCGPMAVVSNLIQLVGEKGIQPGHGAFLISITAGANFAGKLILAGVADRIGHRLLLAIALIGIGLGIGGLLYANSFSLLAASCSVIGLFAGAASPLWSVILAHVYGADRIGKMMGLMTLVIMPFTLLSAPLFGWIYDLTGNYDNALQGYIGLVVLALLFVSQLRICRLDGISGEATNPRRVLPCD